MFQSNTNQQKSLKKFNQINEEQPMKKMNYQIIGNNYACVAIDAKTMMDSVSKWFSKRENIKETIEMIRMWSENCNSGDIMEIDGFQVSTIERN